LQWRLLRQVEGIAEFLRRQRWTGREGEETPRGLALRTLRQTLGPVPGEPHIDVVAQAVQFRFDLTHPVGQTRRIDETPLAVVTQLPPADLNGHPCQRQLDARIPDLRVLQEDFGHREWASGRLVTQGVGWDQESHQFDPLASEAFDKGNERGHLLRKVGLVVPDRILGPANPRLPEQVG